MPEDPAIAALKRLARPQPKAVGEPLPPVPEHSGGSGSATGFVGTLGKRPGEPLPGDSMAGTPGVKPANTLRMAREVRPKRALSPLEQIAKDAAKDEEADLPEEILPPAPQRSAAMPYLMMGLAAVLLVIGAWAVGALMYMHNSQPISPRDVTYPFLTWHIDPRTGGAYTSASVAMAWSMLVCLPVATLLMVFGWTMRRRKP